VAQLAVEVETNQQVRNPCSVCLEAIRVRVAEREDRSDGHDELSSVMIEWEPSSWIEKRSIRSR
jgi:hypothetical protein